ncbi:hypothetical protein K7957_06575 [Sphingomonas yunnanensis]|uniref:hypothetical protein n=1 Tax=Sphingomonas yunnanensis TaxID=310400 RepID=UPI001CA6C28B|nr:hypothetical protein [Sphingomonas yunnanensis]MBY9062591.1 hypothetical protein [Sphingomonas yunnanensis]
MNATIVAALTSLVLVAPAQAEPTAPSAVATTAATPAEGGVRARNPSTRYCYNTEATGSHIIQRVCHTRAEWKELGVKVPERL